MKHVGRVKVAARVDPRVISCFARQAEPRRQRPLVLHQAIYLDPIQIDGARRMPTYYDAGRG